MIGLASAQMNEAQRYEQVDLPFYRDQVAPVLPERVLDFHVHLLRREHWKRLPGETEAQGGRYVIAPEHYPVEELVAQVRRLFPDRELAAVCFGMPTPTVDLVASNRYLQECGQAHGLYPLLLAGRGLIGEGELEQAIVAGGFFGYKVFLNWLGDDYGTVTVEDLLGPTEMAIADRHRLVIMLHVPRARRLADPVVQAGVRRLAQDYLNTSIVLAHCGRCYLPDEMQEAVGSVSDLDNVYLDTAMVMDPTVLQIALEHIPPRRLLFATDLPIAAMRGRRVYAADHWVDLVLPGYPPSAYRVAGDNFRATFMVYEIVVAVRRAAERAGLSREEMRGIFWDNGVALLRRVRGGQALAEAERRWSAP